MKKVLLITEADLGDNIGELLALEGFESSIVDSPYCFLNDKFWKPPDLYICEENTLNGNHINQLSTLFHQRPHIILCKDEDSFSSSMTKTVYLRMPFSVDELFLAVNRCMRLPVV